MLSILRDVWDGAPESVSKQIMEALAIFCDKYDGQYERGMLIRKLRQVDPIEIIRDGNVSHSNGSKKYAQQIVNIYNNGRKNRLPDVR